MTDLTAWLAALEQRHLANLTRSELTRAVRALSSCYVERRETLGRGGPLDSAGKRAAFALFYGPLHYLTLTAIVRAYLPGPAPECDRAIGWRGDDRGAEAPCTSLLDLGCGTGVGGAAAAALLGPGGSVIGLDRNAWAIEEANWTYRALGVTGRARRGDASTPDVRSPQSTLILAAYFVNELPEAARAALLDRVDAALAAGSSLLLVEPIARRGREWWGAWMARLDRHRVEEREWRFQSDLPPLLREIARGAGLDPRELTARSLSRL